ncbi:precursor of CEP8-like [Nymphaea colorata]|uniref:precursor of CEP8-like n=1 Tax=Nymphaea colorata TaxID=210225 RepID=UPI00129D4415|nr:precursor of CEP8-like [Nymphaea colorata]
MAHRAVSVYLLAIALFLSFAFLSAEGRRHPVSGKLPSLAAIAPAPQHHEGIMSSPGAGFVREANGGGKPPTIDRREEGRMAQETSVDEFRPTTPGHSPGVGHDVHDK